MASQAIYLVDFLTDGWNFISRVYCLASPLLRLLRERSGESGYMPSHFSELKSGEWGVGEQFVCCPPTPKSGGMRPTRPPPIDARAYINLVERLHVGMGMLKYYF